MDTTTYTPSLGDAVLYQGRPAVITGIGAHAAAFYEFESTCPSLPVVEIAVGPYRIRRVVYATDLTPRLVP